MALQSLYINLTTTIDVPISGTVLCFCNGIVTADCVQVPYQFAFVAHNQWRPFACINQLIYRFY